MHGNTPDRDRPDRAGPTKGQEQRLVRARRLRERPPIRGIVLHERGARQGAWHGDDRKGTAQPAIECRGREYLRIIYGPDYTAEANLDRLRQRGLGHKRSFAQREFALGIEALERFARGEPLYRVHECVFGVLALESEPVDPRL